jgi:hypothetical protein
MPYEDHAPLVMPGPLRGYWGSRFMRAIGKRLDSIAQKFRDAVTARLPGTVNGANIAPDGALDYIGTERGLPRASGELGPAYADRLAGAWDAWEGDNVPLTGKGGGGGSHLGMLKQLQVAGFPMGATGCTIIQHNGVYAQLDGSGNLVKGDGPLAIFRKDLLGTAGALKGFTLDARDQFYSKFAILFLVDVPTLRAGNSQAALLNSIVEKWRPAGATFVGTYVELAGAIYWDWPGTLTWNDGVSTWDTGGNFFIPPSN